MSYWYGLYISQNGDSVEVLDSTKSLVLYSANVERSEPRITVFRPSTIIPSDELLAMVTSHRLSGNMTIQMSDGKQLNLRHKSLFSRTHKFEIFGLQYNWTWDGPGAKKMRLVDEASSRTIAAYCNETPLTGQVLGIFQIFDKFSIYIVDAIIASGLAKIGHKQINHELQRVRQRRY